MKLVRDVKFPFATLRKEVLAYLMIVQIPTHYKAATQGAAERAGIELTKQELTKYSEDLREKIAIKGLDGMAYTGAPYHAVFLSEWVTSQGRLINNDKIFIPIRGELIDLARKEADRRFPFLFNKTEMPMHKHAVRYFYTLIIEFHVRWFFKTKFPKSYLKPSNSGKYSQPAADDFRLALPFLGEWMCDVSSPSKDGKHGNVDQKPKAHIHIFAHIGKDDVVVDGWVKGERFANERMFPEQVPSITELMVALNWEEAGNSWPEFVELTRQRLRETA